MTSVHFGLGQATQVDQVEIHRPNGRLPGVDRNFAIEEAKGLVHRVYDAMTTKRTQAKQPGSAPLNKSGK